MARLPAELCTMVLENLRHDLQALKICSLVSRAWAGDAQRLLFRNHFVRVGAAADAQPFPSGPRDDERTPSDFIACVKTSTTMVRFVASVHLSITDIYGMLTNGPGGDSAWTMEGLLQAVLDVSMSELQILSLFFMDGYSDHYADMEPVLPRLSSPLPIPSTSSLQSVTNLILSSVYCIPDLGTIQHLLCSLPHLKEFTCGGLILESTALLASPPTNLALSRLVIGSHVDYLEPDIPEPNSLVFMEWLEKTETTRTLRYLDLYVIRSAILYTDANSFTGHSNWYNLCMIGSVSALSLFSNVNSCCLASLSRFRGPSVQEAQFTVTKRVANNGEICVGELCILAGFVSGSSWHRLTILIDLGDLTSVKFTTLPPFSRPAFLGRFKGFLRQIGSSRVLVKEGSALQEIWGCATLQSLFSESDNPNTVVFPDGIHLHDESSEE
jgi:hypothetical protein